MLTVFLRTLLMYLLLVGGIRLLGKRQVGQMEPSEFVVTMMTANLATAAIENPEAAPIHSVWAILTILGAELTLTWLVMGSIPMRRLLCGKPVILIENGRLLERELRRTRVTLDELMGRLRARQVLDLKTVQYAILETDGTLSVFLYPRELPPSAGDLQLRPPARSLPVTLVEDGALLRENIRYAGKTESWVRGALRERGAEPGDTLLFSLDGEGRTLFLRREAGR